MRATCVELASGVDFRVVYETCSCAPLTPENAVAGTPLREAAHAAPLHYLLESYVVLTVLLHLHNPGQLRRGTDVSCRITAESVYALPMQDALVAHASNTRAAHKEIRSKPKNA